MVVVALRMPASSRRSPWPGSPTCLYGRRGLGPQEPGQLGLGHRQLRLLDRHRPRRHADLGVNSFLDGTKSGIEMAAVANATGLTPPPDGLRFPPCGTHEMAQVLRPGNEGVLHHAGQVEVISSLHRDGRDVEERSALGRLCRVRGTQRLHDAMLQGIWRCHRRIRTHFRAVPAVPSDRTGTERVDPVGSTAPRSDRRAHRHSAAMWWQRRSAT